MTGVTVHEATVFWCECCHIVIDGKRHGYQTEQGDHSEESSKLFHWGFSLINRKLFLFLSQGWALSRALHLACGTGRWSTWRGPPTIYPKPGDAAARQGPATVHRGC